jgi:hypothetical protein
MLYPIPVDYALNYHVHCDTINDSTPASRCRTEIVPAGPQIRGGRYVGREGSAVISP